MTKIEWCDICVNPVIGCKRGCRYCYAERMNKRFKWTPDFRVPTFRPEQLKKLNSKKPQSIFMDSMSDVCYWSSEAVMETLVAMKRNNHHDYLLLSKDIEEMEKRFYTANKVLDDVVAIEPLKTLWLWFGESHTQGEYKMKSVCPNFLSIEPLLGPIDFPHDLIINSWLQVVIIGAETGNSKDKVVPEKRWVQDIVHMCDMGGKKVFMKNSLCELMGDEFRQDRLPWVLGGKK